jgi:hypothetical protein
VVDVIIQAIVKPKRWLIAGVAATLVLAVFMEGIARIVLGGPMKPAVLICQVLGWDLSLLWLAEILHYALGLIAFPIGFAVFRAVMSKGSTILSGAIWGVVLWIGASTVMAPAAGVALFFGGGKMMVASLVAHVAYGMTLGAAFGNRRVEGS